MPLMMIIITMTMMMLMVVVVVSSSSMFLTTKHTSLHARNRATRRPTRRAWRRRVPSDFLRSTEAGSRAEQGADFAESFVRRLVHNGDELVTRQKCGKLFVGYALCLETAQQRRRHQHDPDS